MSVLLHACLFCVHRTALYALDKALHKVAIRWPPLPSRPDSVWTTKSGAFLMINSLIEHLFLVALCLRTYESPLCSVWTIPRFYALFWLDDFMYTLLHASLHWGPAYRTIHYHHHTQRYPSRGYRDAGNENPIEQTLALALHIMAVQTVDRFVSLDWTAVVAHLSVKAAGSCLNHIDRAVVIRLGLGIRLDAAYHHRHHQKGTVNFAQFIPSLDRILSQKKIY